MKVKKTLGTVLTSLGFVVGFAALTSAAPGSAIDTTGPNSINKVTNTSTKQLKVMNLNHLTASNLNTQTAKSGNAKTSNNTTGGEIGRAHV